MNLAKRISLFFLVALAVVLAGFSASIFYLDRSHLYHQLSEVTEAAFDTLNAAVESGPRGLEWETNDRKLAIDQPDGGTLVWAVFDDAGARLEGAQGPVLSLIQPRGAFTEETQQSEDTEWNGECWKIQRREIRAEARDDKSSLSGATRDDDPAAKRYPSLVIAVGTSLSHIANQLRSLAMTLVGLSVLIWLSAAFLGRWLCRNALAPLTHMTESMARISAADLNQRLLTPSTGDELEGLSRAFNDLLDRLQISFDRQRQFAAEASHQLRTPLTAMLGQVDVALRRDRSPAEYRRTLQTVDEQATRLRRIVEMLLFLTREATDMALPPFNSIELNDWLIHQLPSWQQHPRYRDLRVELEPNGRLWIEAHEELLGEVVGNLIDNACKYSAPNSAIVVRTMQSDDGVTLVIEDNGFGISENELDRVVDPFFRSPDARQRGIAGSGLGLSIVHRIVRAFGAKMSVESRVGCGSTFSITFRASAETRQQCA